MIRAVLFDAAGTLIEPVETVGETYARHGAQHGLQISAWRLADAFARVFAATPPSAFHEHAPDARRSAERAWWHAVVRQTFRSADSANRPDDFEALFDALWSEYADAAHWRLRDGAIPLLERLRAQQQRIAVVSNFDSRLPQLLEGLGLHPLLDAVVLAGDAGVAKPDPGIFAFALSKLGVAAEEALFVGDHPDQDVAGARAAGLHAVDVGTLATLTDLQLPDLP